MADQELQQLIGEAQKRGLYKDDPEMTQLLQEASKRGILKPSAPPKPQSAIDKVSPLVEKTISGTKFTPNSDAGARLTQLLTTASKHGYDKLPLPTQQEVSRRLKRIAEDPYAPQSGSLDRQKEQGLGPSLLSKVGNLIGAPFEAIDTRAQILAQKLHLASKGGREAFNAKVEALRKQFPLLTEEKAQELVASSGSSFVRQLQPGRTQAAEEAHAALLNKIVPGSGTAARGVFHAAEGLATPSMLALGGLLGAAAKGGKLVKGISRAATGAFAADMLQKGTEASHSSDPARAAEGKVQILLGLLAAGHASGIHERVAASRVEKATAKRIESVKPGEGTLPKEPVKPSAPSSKVTAKGKPDTQQLYNTIADKFKSRGRLDYPTEAQARSAQKALANRGIDTEVSVPKKGIDGKPLGPYRVTAPKGEAIPTTPNAPQSRQEARTEAQAPNTGATTPRPTKPPGEAPTAIRSALAEAPVPTEAKGEAKAPAKTRPKSRNVAPKPDTPPVNIKTGAKLDPDIKAQAAKPSGIEHGSKGYRGNPYSDKSYTVVDESTHAQLLRKGDNFVVRDGSGNQVLAVNNEGVAKGRFTRETNRGVEEAQKVTEALAPKPQEKANAIQEQGSESGVLRQERPEVELQRLGEGDKGQEVTGKGKEQEAAAKVGPITPDQTAAKLKELGWQDTPQNRVKAAQRIIEERGGTTEVKGTATGDFRLSREEKANLDKLSREDKPLPKKPGSQAGAVKLPNVPNPLPAVGRAAARIKAASQATGTALRQVATPGATDANAKATQSIMRKRLAQMARSQEQFNSFARPHEKVLRRLTDKEKLDFIDRVEKGEAHAAPKHQAAADFLRKALDTKAEEVRSLGTGALDQLIDNYFPHLWDLTKKGMKEKYGEVYGRRPLHGSKSFLKQRTIPTLKEGIDAGMKPATTDPIEMTMLKLHEMDRFILGQRVVAEMKQKGLLRFERANKPPEPGYTAIKDPLGSVIIRKPGSLPQIAGHWYAPDEAARVLNNHLSPGLRNHDLTAIRKTFQGGMNLNNSLNSAQLGWSAFHLGFISFDSMVSKFSLGTRQILEGSLTRNRDWPQVLTGVSNIVRSNPLMAPIETFVKGWKLDREYMKGDNTALPYTPMAQMVDSLILGGGRVRMDSFYQNSAAGNFWKAMHRFGASVRGKEYWSAIKQSPGLLVRLPFAVMDAAAKPIMEYVVPRMKLGVFADMAEHEWRRLEKQGVTDPERYTVEMAKAWDSVDNRMGQMVYDNLFWDRTLKDMSLLSIRAVGWGLGTIRELGGGVMDTATALSRWREGDPVVTNRMAYTIGLPILAALYGAMYQYMRTGQGPQELKDYFQPKNGRLNPDGTPQRVQLPTYMRDVTAWKEKGIPATIASKLSPLVSTIGDMLRNDRFYSNKETPDPNREGVYHQGHRHITTHAPFAKLSSFDFKGAAEELPPFLKDELLYLGEQYEPFSVKNAYRQTEEGESALKQYLGESFFGITPAPKPQPVSD